MGGSIPLEPRLPSLRRENDAGFRLPDGVWIHSELTRAESSRILVVYHHGDGGAFEMSTHNRDRFVEDGISFFAYDARCHGRSGGGSRMKRSHLSRGVPQFADDLAFVLREQIPYDEFDHVFLLGNSLGTAIISYLEMSLCSSGISNGINSISEKIRGAILIGLCMTFPGGGCPCLRSASCLWCPATLCPCIRDPTSMGVDMMLSSEAPAEFRRIFEEENPTGDGLLSGENYTVFYGQSVLAAAEYVLNHLNHFRLPVFLMHGEGDRVTDIDGSRRFFEECATPAPQKKLKTYPGLRHILLMEYRWREVVDDAIEWIRGILLEERRGEIGDQIRQIDESSEDYS